jgi:hypothetical protein
MPVHKLYCDSRAAVEGTPSDWLWQPPRAIFVGKCRAFIDAVHMGVTWGSVVESNKNMYVAEELPLLTVMATQNRIYFREGVTELIAVIPPAIYDGNALATAVAQALTAAGSTVYTAAYTASTTGSIAITPAITIASRVTLLSGEWAGQKLTKTLLYDASDVLGTKYTDSQGTLALGRGIGYRKISLTTGSYNADELATEVALKLNAGSALTGSDGGTEMYTVSFDLKTGRLTISHDNPYSKFYIYPESHLTVFPHEFQGYSAPYNGSDLLLGFAGAVYQGNIATAMAHVNVLAYHTLFINSTMGLHNDSVGPMGQSTIARKVVIDAPPGGMVHDFHSTPYDYIALEPQSITSIRFRVSDWKGETVDMSHWSCSIILVPEDQF